MTPEQAERLVSIAMTGNSGAVALAADEMGVDLAGLGMFGKAILANEIQSRPRWERQRLLNEATFESAGVDPAITREALAEMTNYGVFEQAGEDLSRLADEGNGPLSPQPVARGLEGTNITPAANPRGQATPRAPAGGPDRELVAATIETADRLGVDPSDLLTVVGYETIGTYDPHKRGGKNGNYVGLIQFGPEERARFGYDKNQTAAEQMRGPVFNYLSTRGVKPGMGIEDIYSTVLTGSPGNYTRADQNGTVLQHIDRMNRDYRPAVESMVVDQLLASIDDPAALGYANIPQEELPSFYRWNPDPIGQSQARESTVDPNMQAIVRRAFEISDIPFVVGSGRRNAAEQATAQALGWSSTPNSLHLGGSAVDLWALDPKGQISFDPEPYQEINRAMTQAATELGLNPGGLTWGGTWGTPDNPHFQLNEGAKLTPPPPRAKPMRSGGDLAETVTRAASEQPRPESYDISELKDWGSFPTPDPDRSTRADDSWTMYGSAGGYAAGGDFEQAAPQPTRTAPAPRPAPRPQAPTTMYDGGYPSTAPAQKPGDWAREALEIDVTRGQGVPTPQPKPATAPAFASTNINELDWGDFPEPTATAQLTPPAPQPKPNMAAVPQPAPPVPQARPQPAPAAAPTMYSGGFPATPRIAPAVQALQNAGANHISIGGNMASGPGDPGGGASRAYATGTTDRGEHVLAYDHGDGNYRAWREDPRTGRYVEVSTSGGSGSGMSSSGGKG